MVRLKIISFLSIIYSKNKVIENKFSVYIYLFLEHINRAISLVDWENMFLPLDASEQAKLFNETLLNIFSNFIPRKTIKCKFKEPPWMSKEIKTTLGVLIFAGTNFREFFSPYIRGYLFSRMIFYSTFAGTNFREWVVSIANLLGKYVEE